MNVLITGSEGFIGKNLNLYLKQFPDITVHTFNRKQDEHELSALLQDMDFVFHLAGVNRPQNPADFTTDNIGLTEVLYQSIAEVIHKTGRKIPVLFSSSIHAEAETDYGRSKRAAENRLASLFNEFDNPVYICRLPGVFGKWARPNYNSVVATFCHNIANEKPVHIDDPEKAIRLVYIDDVMASFVRVMDGNSVDVDNSIFLEVKPEFNVKLGDIVSTLGNFKHSRKTLINERVGTGFVRALYSTYISYLPVSQFSYPVKAHSDSRGTFVEAFKSHDSGQVSYFTAYPGITRGGHYHHTKTEKFLVLSGKARFKFRHMITGEYYEVVTSDAEPVIIETIPGWAHDVTNIGSETLIAIVWANEIFDPENPDTFSSPL